MAKFCTKCGRRLTEGEICTCSSEQGENPVVSNQETVHSKSESSGMAQQESTPTGQSGYGEGPYQGQGQDPYQGNGQGMYGGPQGNYGQGPQGGYNGWQQGPYPGAGQGPYQGQGQGPYQGQRQGMYGGPQGGYNGWQQGPYGSRQQGNFNGQWIQEKTDQFVKNTKNMFAEILPLITKPDSTMKRICDNNNSVMGLEMVGLKALICILLTLFITSKLKSGLGGYMEIPVFSLLLLVLLITVGFAYMQAGIFKGMTMAFGGETTLNKMMAAIGFSAFVDSVMILLSAIFITSFPKFAIAVIVILSLISFCFYLRGYEHAVSMQPDRKVYCFVISTILTAIAIFVVLKVVLPLLFNIPFSGSGLMEEMMGSFM